MKLPHPGADIFGIVWLPRLIAKIRLKMAGQLPLSYRLPFGSPHGMDGHFCRHFGIDIEDLVAAVRLYRTESAIYDWFINQPGVTDESVERWREIAPRIGDRGQPGHRALRIARWLLYPKLWFTPVRTIFEAIELDENLPKPVSNVERFGWRAR